MAKNYTIKKVDLTKIVDSQLGDAGLGSILADFNDKPDPKQLVLGQQIQIPSSKYAPLGDGCQRTTLCSGQRTPML